jgi:hypothetical protein
MDTKPSKLLPRTMAQAADARQLRAVDIARGGLRRQVALVHRGEAYLIAAAKALRGSGADGGKRR